MPLDYTKILKRSFEITKNNRLLWIFGFILALLSGSFIPRFGFGNSEESFRILKKTFLNINFSYLWLVVLMAGIILIVIGLLATFTFSLANGALVDMVDDIENKELITVKGGFKSGFAYALPLIFISLLIWIPFTIVVVLIGGLSIGFGVWLIIAKHAVVGAIMIGIGILVLIVVLIVGIIVLGIINLYANRYFIIKDKGVIDSIKLGFSLLKRNIASSFLLWLINVGVGIGLSIVAVFLAIILGLFLLLLFGLPIYLLVISLGKWLLLLAIFPLVIFIFGLTFLKGLFQTFYSVYWTIAFEQLAQ